ncbi:peptidase [Calothrix sp. HK-06]|nr:peptidase [Calothrix sp. HK-06]
MKLRKFTNVVFILHRYIGLTVGFLVVFIGLTGSLLVFKPEIEQFIVNQKFGSVTPQEKMISINRVLETAKSAIENRPDLTFDSIRLPPKPTLPYQVQFFDATNQLTRLYIHPYTGKIMGWIESDSSIERVILKLHYGLLADRTGEIIVGISGLLLSILSLSGLFLWSGWRKFIAGFKIKWDAHPKRVNFDVHKVTGIITTVFITLTAFTGFCWNFSDLSYPVIYAATFSSELPEVTSKVIPGKSPLQLSELLEKSNTVFSNATTFSVSIPSKPDDAVYIRKKQAHETMFYGQSGVYLDRYSGKLLRVIDSHKQSLGDSIIAAFEPLHYGTFGGFTTRVFYAFVGLAPLILFVTGFIMWWYSKK